MFAHVYEFMPVLSSRCKAGLAYGPRMGVLCLRCCDQLAGQGARPRPLVIEGPGRIQAGRRSRPGRPVLTGRPGHPSFGPAQVVVAVDGWFTADGSLKALGGSQCPRLVIWEGN
jgi:hypothetical protein